MLAEAIAGAFDLDDDGVVQQAVQQRGGDDRVAEDLAPFGKAAVGGQDHGAALVAGIDQLEEQVAAAGDDRQVADLVHDQQLRPAQETQALAQGPLAFGFGQGVDQLGQGAEIDAAPGLDGFYAQREGQVGLAAAGLTDEVDDLRAIDERQLSQRENAVAIE